MFRAEQYRHPELAGSKAESACDAKQEADDVHAVDKAAVRKWVNFDPSQPKSKRKMSSEDPKPKRLKNNTIREHITMWNKMERRKLSGNAAPLRENVAKYLMMHPMYEVYVDQDEVRPPAPNSYLSSSLRCAEFDARLQTTTYEIPDKETKCIEESTTMIPPHGDAASWALIGAAHLHAQQQALWHTTSSPSRQAPQQPQAQEWTCAPQAQEWTCAPQAQEWTCAPQAPQYPYAPSVPYLSEEVPAEEEISVGEEEVADAATIIQLLAQCLVEFPRGAEAALIHNFLLGDEGLNSPMQLNSEFKALIENSAEYQSHPHLPASYQQHFPKEQHIAQHQKNDQYAGVPCEPDLQDIHLLINHLLQQCQPASQPGVQPPAASLGNHGWDDNQDNSQHYSPSQENRDPYDSRHRSRDQGHRPVDDESRMAKEADSSESTSPTRHAEDEHIEEDCSQNCSEDTLNVDEFGFEQGLENLTQMLNMQFCDLPRD